MARHLGSKNKLARRIGEDLGLKSNAAKVAKRIGVRPGMHGHKGRRKVSDYGTQLQEKQKVKYIYGIVEKQLHTLYIEASKNPTATGSALLSLLERRLDNVVYRLGFAPTRAAARQMVSHNHVMVNGAKMSVASYRVQVSDVVMLKPVAMVIPAVAALLKDAPALPNWLERKNHVGKVAQLPERKDIVDSIQEQLIVEFYSR